jgi:Tol biopolymer transport system component
MRSRPCQVALVAFLAFAASCEHTEAPVAPRPFGSPVAQGLEGKIAFSSNRRGFLELYVMNADGTGVTGLNTRIAGARAWSPDGSQIAFYSPADGEIYVVNADGTGVTRLTNSSPFASSSPAWCGNEIAFESNRDGTGTLEIYVMSADGTGVRRVTYNTVSDRFPTWAPTCQQIAFHSYREGPHAELYVMNADGSGVTLLTDTAAYLTSPAWSPDGARIAFVGNPDGNPGNPEICVINADGSEVTRLTDNAAIEGSPAWSPDGSQIAFHSNRDGKYQLYVMNADGTDVTRLTNDDADSAGPAWTGAAPLLVEGH